MSTPQARVLKGNWPTALAELEPSEWLVIWSFRRCAAEMNDRDGVHWGAVKREFGRQFEPEDCAEALAGFAEIMMAMARHASRMIPYHQPECPCLGIDEVAFLCFVEACQTGRRGDAMRISEWMVESTGAPDMVEAAERFTDILQRSGLGLPSRTTKGGDRERLSWASLQSRTLH